MKGRKRFIKCIFMSLILTFLFSAAVSAKDCPDGEHKWGPWETYRAATFSNTGLKGRECMVKGCSAEEEKVIAKKEMDSKQEAVFTEFKTYIKWAKKYNVNKMAKCFQKPSEAKAEYIKWTYLTKIFKKYNPYYLDYEVNSIKVNSKKATLKATISGPSMVDAIYCAFDDLIKYFYKHPTLKQSKYNSYWAKRVRKYTKMFSLKYGDPKKRTVTFNYVKVGNTWKIKEPTKDILDVAEMQFQKGYNRAMKDNYLI